jgi:hypothetical protein
MSGILRMSTMKKEAYDFYDDFTDGFMSDGSMMSSADDDLEYDEENKSIPLI